MVGSSQRPPLISVIICTRNRAGLLDRALTSISAQVFPPEEFEILVVDNGSTDHTAQVVKKFQSNLKVGYLREERPGLCIARNSGWRIAQGRYIAFFDDDAIASPSWLSAIRYGFESSAPSVAVIGGPAKPLWEKPRPDWLPEALLCSLTIVDWGPQQKLIENLDREWLVGANMAVARAQLAEIGGFHPWLDRVGNNLLSSGDVFLQKELMRRGYQCAYVPSMVIGHLVPASRLNQQWFYRRYYWQGVSDAVIHLIERSPSISGRLKTALGRVASMLQSPAGIGPLFARVDSPESLTAKCLKLIDVGFLAGLLGQARR